MTERDPLADLRWPSASVTPSTEVSQCIRGACTKSLCAQRGLSAKTRGIVTIGLSVMLLGYLTWYALLDSRPAGVIQTTLIGAAGWLLAQVLIVSLTLGRPPGKRASRKVQLALLLGVPVLFIAYLALSSTESLTFARFSESAPAQHAITCGAIAFFFGTLVAGGAMVAWRRTDPYHPGLTGGLIGLIGGISGSAGMGVACANHETYHLCLSHGIAMLAVAAVGFGLGKKFLSP